MTDFCHNRKYGQRGSSNETGRSAYHTEQGNDLQYDNKGEGESGLVDGDVQIGVVAVDDDYKWGRVGI